MAALKIIVPWHNPNQLETFLDAWGVPPDHHLLQLQQDKTAAGCARTKNAGIFRAMEEGVKTVVVLDDDCFPSLEAPTLEILAQRHLEKLEQPACVEFRQVTSGSALDALAAATGADDDE